jgi:hypothetical protein
MSGIAAWRKTNRRTYFVAVNTGMVDSLGAPQDDCLRFYQERSGNGLYCAIVGNVVVPSGTGSNDHSARISTDPVWKHLSGVVAHAGALPGIQLATAWEGYEGLRSFKAKNLNEQVAAYKAIAASLSSSGVKAILSSFRSGAELAMMAGFRHIQFHAAHGYLLGLLLDRRFFAGAADVADMLSEQIIWAKSAGSETSIRVSVKTGSRALDEADDSGHLSRIISLPVDTIDVSAGLYNLDKRLIYPYSAEHLAERRRWTVSIAEAQPNKRIIISGFASRHDPSLLPQNVDLGLCRDLIANKDFLASDDKGCELCMKCHYFSRGESNLQCGMWSR